MLKCRVNRPCVCVTLLKSPLPSRSKSSECGMTSWCISNIWQHMDLPEDTDDVCTICKDMVQQARDQLNSNETQVRASASPPSRTGETQVRPVPNILYRDVTLAEGISFAFVIHGNMVIFWVSELIFG